MTAATPFDFVDPISWQTCRGPLRKALFADITRHGWLLGLDQMALAARFAETYGLRRRHDGPGGGSCRRRAASTSCAPSGTRSAPRQKPGRRLEVVLSEWMRREVAVTVVTIPGEKCLNSDFEIHTVQGEIIGAEVRDA